MTTGRINQGSRFDNGDGSARPAVRGARRGAARTSRASERSGAAGRLGPATPGAVGGRGARTAGGPDRARPTAVCVLACRPGSAPRSHACADESACARGRRRRPTPGAALRVGVRKRPDAWPGDGAGTTRAPSVWSARRATVGKFAARPIVKVPSLSAGGSRDQTRSPRSRGFAPASVGPATVAGRDGTVRAP